MLQVGSGSPAKSVPSYSTRGAEAPRRAPSRPRLSGMPRRARAGRSRLRRPTAARCSDDAGCSRTVRSAYFGAISSNSLVTTSGSFGQRRDHRAARRQSPRLARVIMCSTRPRTLLGLRLGGLDALIAQHRHGQVLVQRQARAHLAAELAAVDAVGHGSGLLVSRTARRPRPRPRRRALARSSPSVSGTMKPRMRRRSFISSSDFLPKLRMRSRSSSLSWSSWPTLTMLLRLSELYARIGRSSSSMGMSSMFGGSGRQAACRGDRRGRRARPMVTNGWNWRTRMSAERESASSGVDRAVGLDLDRQLVVVGHLADPHALDPVVDLADRGEDRVHRDDADGQRLGPLGGEVAHAALDGEVHLDRDVVGVDGHEHEVGIDDLDVG